MVLSNSTSVGFADILQSKWVGIIAVKSERTIIHFLSDVLVAVRGVESLKSLTMMAWTRHEHGIHEKQVLVRLVVGSFAYCLG